MPPPPLFDVVVVGAGPAGLSAALVLGRCCRRTLVVDSGAPRNARSSGVHGFLTRDGSDPWEIRRIGREQLARYETVELRDGEVTSARCDGPRFSIDLVGGETIAGRRLLLATGVVDDIPDVQGMEALWGRGVYPCPYCDAWEYRGRRIAVYGRGESGLSQVRALTSWTRDLMLFTDGPTGLSDEDEARLAENQITVVRDRIAFLEETRGSLSRISLVGRPPIERDALFVTGPQRQRSQLVEALGCSLNPRGLVETGEHAATNVPGLFVAGDASGNVQFAVVAAAEGAEAAFAINRSLVREDFAPPLL